MLMPTAKPLGDLENPSEFIARHIGISAADQAHMLSVIGEASRRALIDSIVPRSIARARPMELPAAVTEAAALAELKAMAQKNQVLRSFIGQGYYGTHVYGLTETYGPAAVCAKHEEWLQLPLDEQVRLNGRQGVRYHCEEGITVMDPETMQPVPSIAVPAAPGLPPARS